MREHRSQQGTFRDDADVSLVGNAQPLSAACQSQSSAMTTSSSGAEASPVRRAATASGSFWPAMYASAASLIT